MRKLSDCEFCGAGAAGAFEVAPAGLTPSGESRRAVLCGDCEARLEDLIGPLLEGARTRNGGPEPTGDDPDRNGRRSDGDARREDGDAGSDDECVDGGDAGSGDDRSRGEGDGAGGADGVTASYEGVDGARGSARADADREGGPDDGSDRGTDAPAGDPDAPAADNPDAPVADYTDSSDIADFTDSSGSAGRSDRPRAYGKVLRLVRNREFPMDRSAVESLAAGAYDLDEHEAKKAIDRAIEDGELLEDGEQLRRP